MTKANLDKALSEALARFLDTWQPEDIDNRTAFAADLAALVRRVTEEAAGATCVTLLDKIAAGGLAGTFMLDLAPRRQQG